MKKQFIKGKWYRGGWSKNASQDYFMKFDYKEKNGKLYYTERVHGGKYSKGRGSWWNSDFEEFALNNEVNMEDIRPFLPPNHPDLIGNKIYELW
jgi:hypothetical protein